MPSWCIVFWKSLGRISTGRCCNEMLVYENNNGNCCNLCNQYNYFNFFFFYNFISYISYLHTHLVFIIFLQISKFYLYRASNSVIF